MDRFAECANIEDRAVGRNRGRFGTVTGMVAAQCRNRAACSVFESSMAIVIGPTPPGTGVIAPATSDAEA